ncbi:MAG: translocation/assembly module TamB domain-containing protein [Zoogloeaceae bacterium]|nr:translocation/assembly module TamB domain-containing protein [Zoogloeaceae bacterium]
MPRRRWGRVVGAAISALLLLAVLAFAWLAGTSAGLTWIAGAAGRLAGGEVVVEGVEGGLGGDLRIARLSYRDASLRVEARDLRLLWRPGALRQGRLHLTELSAQTVAWAQTASDTPAVLPASLRLPGAVVVDRLAVGDLAVEDWQDASAPPSLRLTDLVAALASDGRQHGLTDLRVGTPWGRLTLSEGRFDGQAPFPLALRGRLEEDRVPYPYAVNLDLGGQLDVLRFHLKGSGAGGATAEADFTAAPFAEIPLGTARVRIAKLDPSRFDATLPAADLSVDLDLAPEGGGWGVAGRFQAANQRSASLDAGGLPIEGATGHLAWSADGLTLTDLAVQTPGAGAVSGRVRWQSEGQVVEAALSVRDLDLNRVDRRGPATRLAGRISGAGQGGEFSLEAALADPRFALQLKGRGSAATIEVDALSLRAKEGSLEGMGTVGLDGERPFRLQGALSRFDPQALWAEAPAGALNMAFQARGTAGTGWTAEGDFSIRDSRLAGQRLAGAGQFSVSPQRLDLPKLQIDWAGNRLSAQGRLGQSGDRLAWKVAAPDLGRLGLGVQGRVDAEGLVTGRFEALAGSATANAQRLIWPGRLRVASLNLAGQLGAGDAGPWGFSLGASGVGAPGGEAPWADTLSLRLDGTRRAHVLEVQAARGRRDRWRAVLEGGLAAGPVWAGRLREASGDGRFTLNLEAPASLRLGAEAVELGPATLRTTSGAIHLRETRWSPGLTRLRGDFQGLGVGLVTLDGGTTRRGEASLRLAGEWDWRMGERMDGQIRIARESGDLVLIGERAARLGLEAFEVVVNAQSNRLAASLEARGTQLGKLAASVTAAAERGAEGWRLAPDAALSGSARLDIPSVAWIGPLTHPSLSTEGRLEAEFSFSGTPARPVSTGWVRGQGLGLNLADLGLRLSGGTLEADFDRERLRVVRLDFETPAEVLPADPRLRALAAQPGRLDIAGEVGLAQGVGQFRFEARRLPLLQRPERWLMVSGNGNVTTGWDSLDLTTRLKAEGGFIGLADAEAPSLSDDVVILGRGDTAPRTPFRLSVDAQIDLGPQLYLRAAGVSARLTGALHVAGRDGRPLVTRGTVTAAEGGYEGYGQTLAIERGRVNFNGPLDNPALDVVALRKGLAVEAGVAITGTAKRPQVRLVSEPNVPDAEKLAWIVLGRPPDSASGSDLGLLIPAARALLGGPGGGMTAQLASSLGLDLLTIGQGDLGSVSRGATSRVVGTGTTVLGGATVSGQVVSVGKRLSADAFFSVEHSLAGAESIAKLTYQLSRHLAVVVRGGTDNAVDLAYTISLQ